MRGDEGTISFEGVTVAFGGVKALRSASGEIPSKKLTALVGPNGAGKTTLVNTITGFLRPEAGSIFAGAVDITSQPPFLISRRGIGRTFQDLRLFGQLTVFDNVMLGFPSQTGETMLRLFTKWSTVLRQEADLKAEALNLLEFVGLSHKRFVTAKELSYGQQKRLALARVLASGSDTLFLDEPAAGLDPEAVQSVGELLRSLVDSGKTVCLIEHNLELVVERADWVMGMAQGEVVVMGPPKEALSHAGLVGAYMTGGNVDAQS